MKCTSCNCRGDNSGSGCKFFNGRRKRDRQTEREREREREKTLAMVSVISVGMMVMLMKMTPRMIMKMMRIRQNGHFLLIGVLIIRMGSMISFSFRNRKAFDDGKNNKGKYGSGASKVMLIVMWMISPSHGKKEDDDDRDEESLACG